MAATADGILAEVCEHPEDDTPRLVFADWLEEHGEAEGYPHPRERAEFIRLECEMARIHAGPVSPNRWDNPRFWELIEPAERLSKKYGKVWFAPLFGAHRGEVSTHRGFPYHIALSVRKFLERGEAIFRAAPTIEDVFLDRLGRNMPALARCPALGHVRDLTFFETPFRGREAEQLAASPHLGRLRSFHIPFTDTHIGPRGAAALARARSLTCLEDLDIYNHAIFDEGAEALLRAGRLATLRRLHLGNNGLTDATAVVLAQAEHLGRLTFLDLMSNHLSGHGVRQLADSPHLAGLEHLDLNNNPFGQGGIPGAAAVRQSKFARGLRVLRLADCGLADEALAVLLGGAFPALTDLYLPLNVAGEQAFRALAGNTTLGRVRKLALARCRIGVVEARLLGGVDTLPGLRQLSLGHNSLGPEGLRGLLAGPLLRAVTTLELGTAELTDAGAEALAASPAVTALRSLDLSFNRITTRGATALAASPYLGGLRRLSLFGNRVGKKGRDALARRLGDEACRF